jgi:hypothetical protein
LKETYHTVLFAGLAAVVCVGYAVFFYEQQALFYRLWYYTPAAAAAGAWCVGRLREGTVAPAVWVADGCVLAIAIARPRWGLPPVSGHALFAVYAWMTARHRVTASMAMLLLGVTLYAKLVLWHGDLTLWPGLGLGGLLGAWRNRLMSVREGNDNS